MEGGSKPILFASGKFWNYPKFGRVVSKRSKTTPNCCALPSLKKSDFDPAIDETPFFFASGEFWNCQKFGRFVSKRKKKAPNCCALPSLKESGFDPASAGFGFLT